MDKAMMRTRGSAVDELQSRIRELKKKNVTVPADWTRRLNELAETSDSEVVKGHVQWMREKLPPQQYATEKVTWDTFKDLADEAIATIVQRETTAALLGKGYPVMSVDLINRIIALRAESESPILALNELEVIKRQAAKVYPDLIAGE